MEYFLILCYVHTKIDINLSEGCPAPIIFFLAVKSIPHFLSIFFLQDRRHMASMADNNMADNVMTIMAVISAVPGTFTSMQVSVLEIATVI